MQSNSFLGLESYSRVKYNVSEIGDCRIAEEQGHSFTTVLRIIRISAWKQVYNNVKCFTYKICKTRDQDPDRVNSRAVHGASRKSHHANMESRRSQKSSTNSCPAVPVILSSKLSSRGHLPVPRSAEVNTHPYTSQPRTKARAVTALSGWGLSWDSSTDPAGSGTEHSLLLTQLWGKTCGEGLDQTTATSWTTTAKFSMEALEMWQKGHRKPWNKWDIGNKCMIAEKSFFILAKLLDSQEKEPIIKGRDKINLKEILQKENKEIKCCCIFIAVKLN